jgi:hypothetical protein
MTLLRAVTVVIGFTVGGAFTGILVGFCLGKFAPGYYQFVFAVRRDQTFDPVDVGIGQGLTQGIIGGVIIGIVLVTILALYNIRQESRSSKSSDRD